MQTVRYCIFSTIPRATWSPILQDQWLSGEAQSSSAINDLGMYSGNLKLCGCLGGEASGPFLIFFSFLLFLIGRLGGHSLLFPIERFFRKLYFILPRRNWSARDLFAIQPSYWIHLFYFLIFWLATCKSLFARTWLMIFRSVNSEIGGTSEGSTLPISSR